MHMLVPKRAKSKARVRGDEVRGRELIVQAFLANKTLLAI